MNSEKLEKMIANAIVTVWSVTGIALCIYFTYLVLLYSFS